MKIFTIFGDPVSHSRSPLMHNTVFKTLGINACYTRTHLDDGALLKETFFAKKLNGANVTVPHKEAAFQACDEVRGVAKEIGAVNTLIEENGRLIGYNTDADGFYSAIQSFGSLSNALILGAGGTARALAIVLRHHNITPTILNRSKNRLSYFQDNGFESYTWETFMPNTYDMIINTTSAGLSDNHLPIDETLLTTLLSRAKCAVDVIYGKETPFLSVVKKASLPYKDGSNMLLEQGVLANILFLNNQFSAQEIEPIMHRSFLL
ncbi:MAG: shikimate dehydrogenase [Sulfuricurvum sp.]|uniref:shikimate dehydrogenase n=1 Tax=Sulfuricurvum sp. TaxID=2025608 RepID=UPI002622A411|nr:shikimate dehydrogenase [Sulfuricurvum sp.]MDD2829069.1 shikimate dehydrogenase [Sulfuricurvum sp.]MDD4948817.1 shikimate dehydrogenase [Sulfuricurvum sp.]